MNAVAMNPALLRGKVGADTYNFSQLIIIPIEQLGHANEIDSPQF